MEKKYLISLLLASLGNRVAITDLYQGDDEVEGPKNVDTFIEPTFDLKAAHRRLRAPAVTTKEKLKMLIGIHYRFWHAAKMEMRKMLYREGHAPRKSRFSDQIRF